MCVILVTVRLSSSFDIILWQLVMRLIKQVAIISHKEYYNE